MRMALSSASGISMRRGLGDVEAVDEAVADQIEIAGDRRARFAAKRTQAREHLRGVAVGCEHRAAAGSWANARFRRSISSEPPADTSAEPRIRPSRSDVRQARPVADMGEEIPGGKHGAGGEAHVLGDHGRMVVAAARQIGDQLRIGEGVRIDGLQLPVRGDGGWLAFLVPVAKLLPPELLREDLFGALKALGDFGLRRRQHLVVAEALDVAASGGRR